MDGCKVETPPLDIVEEFRRAVACDHQCREYGIDQSRRKRGSTCWFCLKCNADWVVGDQVQPGKWVLYA